MYVIKSNRNTNSYTVRKIDRITQVVRVGRRGLQGETGPQGPQGPKGDQGDPATNLVQSVNGKQGVVVLNATDVGADPTGSASQALQDAKDYTDTEVSTLDSSLATVAKTGSYNDLSNKPTIPSIAGLATETYVNNAVAPKANTSDLGTAAFEDVEDLPVSTAQQTALNAKANASDTVNLTGNQTVAGVKTFSSSPVVPTATTGTQAVNKAQMDAKTDIEGTGFPNGVVSAPVGRTYKDLNATNGAVVWTKMSGTGPTGWVVSVGDTGWRDITTSFNAYLEKVNVNDYGVYIRRVDNTVTISIKAQSKLASFNGETTAIPVGFQGTGGIPVYVAEYLGVANPGRLQTQISSTFGFVSSTNISVGTRIYGSTSFPVAAAQAWPSTLPGTAV